MFPSYEQISYKLSTEIRQIEQEHLAVKQTLLLGLLITLPSLILFVATLYMETGDSVTIGAGVVALLGILITLFTFPRKYGRLRRSFKEKIVTGILDEMIKECELPGETADYGYHWEFERIFGMSRERIKRSRLFRYIYDKNRGKDLISGWCQKGI